MDVSQREFFKRVGENEASWYSKMVLSSWKKMKNNSASRDDLEALELGLVWFRDKKGVDVSKELRILDRFRHPEKYEGQPPEEEDEDEGDEGDESLADEDYQDEEDEEEDEGDEGDEEEAEEVDEDEDADVRK